MILLLAVLAGLLAGLLRAQMNRYQLQSIQLRSIELVIAAFGLQALAFWFPGTRRSIPDGMAAGLFMVSLFILLAFALVNLRAPGFWLMGSGLAMNLFIVLLNGGMMPISPENASRLVPQISPAVWQVGQRFFLGKDIVLPESITRFALFSDRFLFPVWLPVKAAFSIGDALIALGAFWLLWTLGGPYPINVTRKVEGV